MSEQKPKRCQIGYKTGLLAGGRVYGKRFYKLIECCPAFGTFFLGTGNIKTTSFDSIEPSVTEGFNFCTRGGGFKLVLHSARNNELEIQYCPACGTKVEILEAFTVTLQDKIVQVRAGLEETNPRVLVEL